MGNLMVALLSKERLIPSLYQIPQTTVGVCGVMMSLVHIATESPEEACTLGGHVRLLC